MAISAVEATKRNPYKEKKSVEKPAEKTPADTEAKNPEAAAVAEKPVEDAKPPEIPTAPRKDIQLREYLNNTWRIRLPAEITLKQAQDAAYIAKVLSIGSQDFRSFDEMLVVSNDASWAVKLLCVDAGVGWCDFQVRETLQFAQRRDQGEARIPQGYSIHRCPHDSTWYGQRDTDGVRLVDGSPSREEATRNLLDHAVFRNH